jgi:hypothetical protein
LSLADIRFDQKSTEYETVSAVVLKTIIEHCALLLSPIHYHEFPEYLLLQLRLFQQPRRELVGLLSVMLEQAL